jgi:hypothetical protein
MNDEQILNKGGTEEDIEAYAKANGADLTKADFDPEVERKDRELEEIFRANFLDGDTLEDSRGTTFTVAGALDAFKFGYEKGKKDYFLD